MIVEASGSMDLLELVKVIMLDMTMETRFIPRAPTNGGMDTKTKESSCWRTWTLNMGNASLGTLRSGWIDMDS